MAVLDSVLQGTAAVGMIADKIGMPIGTLIAIVLGIFVVIQTIVRLTPTKRDDKVLGKVIHFIFEKTNRK